MAHRDHAYDADTSRVSDTLRASNSASTAVSIDNDASVVPGIDVFTRTVRGPNSSPNLRSNDDSQAAVSQTIPTGSRTVSAPNPQFDGPSSARMPFTTSNSFPYSMFEPPAFPVSAHGSMSAHYPQFMPVPNMPPSFHPLSLPFATPIDWSLPMGYHTSPSPVPTLPQLHPSMYPPNALTNLFSSQLAGGAAGSQMLGINTLQTQNAMGLQLPGFHHLGQGGPSNFQIGAHHFPSHFNFATQFPATSQTLMASVGFAPGPPPPGDFGQYNRTSHAPFRQPQPATGHEGANQFPLRTNLSVIPPTKPASAGIGSTSASNITSSRSAPPSAVAEELRAPSDSDSLRSNAVLRSRTADAPSGPHPGRPSSSTSMDSATASPFDSDSNFAPPNKRRRKDTAKAKASSSAPPRLKSIEPTHGPSGGESTGAAAVHARSSSALSIEAEAEAEHADGQPRTERGTVSRGMSDRVSVKWSANAAPVTENPTKSASRKRGSGADESPQARPQKPLKRDAADGLNVSSAAPSTDSLDLDGDGNRTDSERDGLDAVSSDEEGFFPCKSPRCTQIFRSRSALRQHAKTHQKEKGYVCSIPGCGSRFAESTALKRHIRVHNGEKPYMCRFDGCNRMFADATNAKRHELTHTGEKPFYCVVGTCKKHFARRSSLKAHMIRQHSLPADSEVILRVITREPTIPPERRPPTQKALVPAPSIRALSPPPIESDSSITINQTLSVNDGVPPTTKDPPSEHYASTASGSTSTSLALKPDREVN